jgi:hypothetical protein
MPAGLAVGLWLALLEQLLWQGSAGG